MDISPGVMVQAMVLDTLSGRSPLYRMKDFLADRDVELLLGEDIPAESFSDVSVGRSLDAMFKAGPSKIVTELGVRATDLFALDTHAPSYDTTSQAFGVITQTAKVPNRHRALGLRGDFCLCRRFSYGDTSESRSPCAQ